MDVDTGGRRGEGGGEVVDGADELPAYEVGKEPPGYHVVGVGRTARPDVVQIGLPRRATVGQDTPCGDAPGYTPPLVSSETQRLERLPGESFPATEVTPSRK